MAAPVLDALPKDRLIDLVGQPLPVAAACIEQCALYVGNDSGLMHIAAATGTPTLGLFGPSDDVLYAPWGPDARVVRGARSFEQIRQQDPELNQSFCHMMDLSVDTVARAAYDLLAQTETSHG